MRKMFFDNKKWWLLIIARKAFSLARIIRYWTLFQVTFFIDCFLSKQFHAKDIFQIFPGKSSKKNSYVCIFSHFDPNNTVDPYVIYYLQELAKKDCDIIFVTTSLTLSTASRNELSLYCKKIILRQNRGRDFGTYKCGIEAIDDIEQYEKVILANDSVYGPIFDLTEILHYGDKNHLDMWGASDSMNYFYHIQSYFVVFGKRLIKNPAFLQFWNAILYLGSRRNIINHYEMGLSRFFVKQGFKLGALCSYASIQHDLRAQPKLQNQLDQKTQRLLKMRSLLNPTHYFWNVIITDYRFPFIKRELLLHNPENLVISQWKEVIRTHSHFNVDMIQQHLSRLSKTA